VTPSKGNNRTTN